MSRRKRLVAIAGLYFMLKRRRERLRKTKPWRKSWISRHEGLGVGLYNNLLKELDSYLL